MTGKGEPWHTKEEEDGTGDAEFHGTGAAGFRGKI